MIDMKVWLWIKKHSFITILLLVLMTSPIYNNDMRIGNVSKAIGNLTSMVIVFYFSIKWLFVRNKK